jgi:signal transduction histidine kinase
VKARLRIYVAAVIVAACALLALHAPHDLEARWWHYTLWVLLCVFSETMWLSTLSGAGTLSMASTANLATAMLWGQSPAMWITAASSLLAELFVQRKPWVRAAFNAAQIAITLWVACWVFALLGGPLSGFESVGGLPAGASTAIRMAVPILGLFAGYLLVNRALVAVAIAWSTERPYLRVLREDWFYAERLLDDMASLFLSPLMVVSYKSIGYIGVLLFYAPLRMIKESTRRQIEIRNAQKQLIHSERMAAKGEMAAEIGHELRNQLVAISGRAQMLLKDAEKQRWEHVGRHAQIVLEQSNRMEALSKGLMDFSRAELNIERVDVNALLQRSVEFVRSQNRFDGVEWDLRLMEPLPELRADPGQLQQVFLNLFLNAADAMNEKGGARKIIGVTSSCDERAQLIRVTVSDTGTGIAASNLSRIFEPHFTTKPQGHGFGLSTSYRIITNHGGKIVAESPPAQGATFSITLPLDRAGAWT